MHKKAKTKIYRDGTASWTMSGGQPQFNQYHREIRTEFTSSFRTYVGIHLRIDCTRMCLPFPPHEHIPSFLTNTISLNTPESPMHALIRQLLNYTQTTWIYNSTGPLLPGRSSTVQSGQTITGMVGICV